MARFVGFLSCILGRTVIDVTGLKGLYDFNLKFGLNLDADRVPVDHLFIDHLEQPSENRQFA